MLFFDGESGLNDSEIRQTRGKLPTKIRYRTVLGWGNIISEFPLLFFPFIFPNRHSSIPNKGKIENWKESFEGDFFRRLAGPCQGYQWNEFSNLIKHCKIYNCFQDVGTPELILCVCFSNLSCFQKSLLKNLFRLFPASQPRLRDLVVEPWLMYWSKFQREKSHSCCCCQSRWQFDIRNLFGRNRKKRWFDDRKFVVVGKMCFWLFSLNCPAAALVGSQETHGENVIAI